LGAGVLQLGFGVLSGIEIDLRAKGEMRSLRDGPNSFITSAVGERDGLDALYIAVERSREEVALTMRIGSRLPLFFSSVGRAILVGLSEEKRAEILEKAKAQDPDGHAARLSSLKRALSDYRSYGYCTGYGDWRPDVNAIAVPVFPIDCTRVYGLNAGGPSFHVKRKQLEKVYGPMLRAASERLGAKSAESKS
jgi:DNA-binding IclR family transcriptional regulator